MQQFGPGNRQIAYAFNEGSLAPVDLHKELKRSGRAEKTKEGLIVKTPGMRQTGLSSVPLDFQSWLPAASPHYHVSPNFNDYVLVPVIIMPSDIPNRNAVAFPRQELVKFYPHLGQTAYKTWKGKPVHYEHQNEDITKAYGIIADSFFKRMPNRGQGQIFKVLLLLAWDRTKHPETVSRIIAGDLNSYSMGAFVGTYTCSYCSHELGTCIHLDPKDPTNMYELNGRLVFRNVVDPEGFECSGVEGPAYISAISDSFIQVKTN